MSDLDLDNQDSHQTNSGLSGGAIIIGKIYDIDEQGRPLVNFNENPTNELSVALTTISITKSHISRQVALLFTNGDLTQPVIMGLIHNPLDEILENFELTPIQDHATQDNHSLPEEDVKSATQDKPLVTGNGNSILVDGKKVEINAEDEVTFKCGKASITLTKSGKIMIRGSYILNRSTGVNKIMGGSVQVN